MKKNILKYLIMMLAIATFTTSCLKSNLDDLPAWDGSNITSVNFEYRYSGPNSWVNGEQVVEYKTMTTNTVFDNDAKTATCTITVPAANGTFTAAEREKVSLSSIVCYTAISTAAKIAPVSGSPTLGSIADWTQPHQYVVTAADGSKSTWTITVTAFNK